MGNLGLDMNEWKLESNGLIVGDVIAVLEEWGIEKGRVYEISKTGRIRWKNEKNEKRTMNGQRVFRKRWKDEEIRELCRLVDKKQRHALLVPRIHLAAFIKTKERNRNIPRVSWV